MPTVFAMENSNSLLRDNGGKVCVCVYKKQEGRKKGKIAKERGGGTCLSETYLEGKKQEEYLYLSRLKI